MRIASKRIYSDNNETYEIIDTLVFNLESEVIDYAKKLNLDVGFIDGCTALLLRKIENAKVISEEIIKKETNKNQTTLVKKE